MPSEYQAKWSAKFYLKYMHKVTEVGEQFIQKEKARLSKMRDDKHIRADKKERGGRLELNSC